MRHLEAEIRLLRRDSRSPSPSSSTGRRSFSPPRDEGFREPSPGRMRWRQRRAAAAGSGAPVSEPLDRPVLSADDEQWEDAIAASHALSERLESRWGDADAYREQHGSPPPPRYEPPLEPQRERSPRRSQWTSFRERTSVLNAGHADEGEGAFWVPDPQWPTRLMDPEEDAAGAMLEDASYVRVMETTRALRDRLESRI